MPANHNAQPQPTETIRRAIQNQIHPELKQALFAFLNEHDILKQATQNLQDRVHSLERKTTPTEGTP
jgi:hemerythrin-like domain-containing protein